MGCTGWADGTTTPVINVMPPRRRQQPSARFELAPMLDGLFVARMRATRPLTAPLLNQQIISIPNSTTNN